MTENARTASFDPEGFTQGGTLLDDADVIIRNPRFAFFSYPGSDKQTTALMVDLEDGDGKLHEQPYSVGSPEKFVPSDDGRKVLLTGTATSININSNCGKFIKSLVDAGVPRTLLQVDDIGAIADMRIHVAAVAQKDRDGKVIKNDKGYDRTVLLATKLIALPGEKPAGAKTAKGGTKAATGAKSTTAASAPAQAPAASGGAVDEELIGNTIGYLFEAIAAGGGSVPRASVSAKVFQFANTAKDPRKSEAAKLAYNEDFLRSRGELAYDGTVISMAA